jgi:ABC-type antimicrobial peptide transport system permease subunit
MGEDGNRLASKEVVVLINLPKRDTGKPANVVIRGVTPAGIALRPQATLAEGRMFRPGPAEIVAGRAIARGFRGAGIGETLRFGAREWAVVGILDAGGTGFDSEIWGDAEQMLQAFRRIGFSSLVFRLADAAQFDAVKAAIETDPRLTLEAKREQRFYADQSEQLERFIRYLGTGISVIFSIGAIIGAMITMYASVASRTAEIGTLRALGFSRASVLAAFLAEALLLGAVGGVAGLAAAALMQTVAISTTNFQTFAEIAFGFRLTPAIVAASLAFALAMGFVGGFLPAARAARMKIVDALRAA